MRRPRKLVVVFALLFAGSSLMVVFATSAYEDVRPRLQEQSAMQLAHLAGEDADANGIRDDVDEFISRNYADEPGMREAAEQIARSIQPALAVDLSQVQSTAVLAEREVEVMFCVTESMGPLRRADVEAMINKISERTYDTSSRFQKREAFRQRASGADFSKPIHCRPARELMSAKL